jgi:hypothetical protein
VALSCHGSSGVAAAPSWQFETILEASQSQALNRSEAQSARLARLPPMIDVRRSPALLFIFDDETIELPLLNFPAKFRGGITAG